MTEHSQSYPEGATHYRDAWLSVIYDATGDYVKSKRALELAEINGLFDPIDALSQPVSVAQTVWKPISTAPKGRTISVARKGGARDDGSIYWYQAIGHYDPNLGHFHKTYGELYGEPELWAAYPENPERCALSSTDRATLPGHAETMANLDALTISPKPRCTCAAIVNPNIPHARSCPLSRPECK